MGFQWDDDKVEEIARRPHLLGLMAGKDKLTSLHSRWIKYVWGEEHEHVSLQGHRGSYKTTSVTIIGTIWYLLFHPSARIAIVRKTFTDAAEVVLTMREIMQTEAVVSLFAFVHGTAPMMTRAQGKSLMFNFKKAITPEGNIDAYGIHSGITGKHYDRILCDDIVTIEDRISKAEREKTKIRVQELRTNIIDPGRPCGFVGTPWHQRDAWQECPDPIKYDVNTTDILTSEEMETKRATITPVLWAANYLLVHQSDDQALFKDPVFGPWDFLQQNCIMHLDSAYDGNHYCAMTIVKKLKDGKYQAFGKTYPGNVKDWYGVIVEHYKKFRCSCLYNETNADKGFVADALRGNGLVVREYAEKQNKHLKISTHLYKAWPGIVWDNSTDPEYMEQCIDYRAGQEPDDAPDSAASLWREAFGDGDQSALYQM